MQMTKQNLSPDNNALREAAVKALKDRVGSDAVDKFANAAASGASALGATVTLKIAVWGKLDVEPDGQPWNYDVTVWGGPAYFGSSVGFMYTAYASWEDFFQNVTGCHVQGVDVGGGILQVNWINSDGTPVGQFNGAAGGVGAVEAGGKGKWQHT